MITTNTLLQQRYRIEKLLGQGGMGAVYQAFDTRLNSRVAIKMMAPQVSLDPSMLTQLRRQFQHEAQTLACLRHAHLVRVIDYFSEQGADYLVMEFVQGENLADRIAREGRQPEQQVTIWALQLLDALKYCHGEGVIHRDIKPGNIIITTVQGKTKAILVDFGLMKVWTPRDPHTKLVRGFGTLTYAPPEQFGGGYTDPRSDLYSLGATLYHALTGKEPPTAPDRIANGIMLTLPGVSALLQDVVLKEMELRKEDRFGSASEMADILSRAAMTPEPDPPPVNHPPAITPMPPSPMPAKTAVSLSLLSPQ